MFMSKLHQLPIEIHEKNTSKQHRFFVDRNYVKKARRNDVYFSPVKIISYKVRRNDVDFLPIEITSKKVPRNDEEFLVIEITSKKSVKMTWKFFNVFFTTYQCNIDIKSTSIRLGVSVALNS